MDSQWLKTQFKLNPKKSKAALARALALEPPAISKILAGTRQIKAQEYVKMRKFFDLVTENHGFQKVEYTPQKQSSYEMQEKDNADHDWVVPSYIGSHKDRILPKKIRIYEIQEPNLSPILNLGEYVVVDLEDKALELPGVFIVSDNYEYFARHCSYAKNNSKEEIVLETNGNDSSAQTVKSSHIKIIGRIIAKVNWV